MWHIKDILFLALAFKTYITMHLENFQVSIRRTKNYYNASRIEDKNKEIQAKKRKYSKWKK